MADVFTGETGTFDDITASGKENRETVKTRVPAPNEWLSVDEEMFSHLFSENKSPILSGDELKKLHIEWPIRMKQEDMDKIQMDLSKAKTLNEKKKVIQDVVVQKTAEKVDKLKTDIDKIKETLTELSPEKVESAIRSTEEIINIFPESKHKTLLRGYAGSVILEQFHKYNHDMIIDAKGIISLKLINGVENNNQIVQNKIAVESKMNALVGENKSFIDTLRIGMLYRSPSFIEYSNTVRDNTDEHILNPQDTKDPNKYFEFLEKKQKAGYKLSRSEETLMTSRKGFDGLNMLPVVEQSKDLGQVQKAVEAITAQLSSTNNNSAQPGVLPGAPQSGNNIPSAVGGTVGVLGGGLGKLAGASGIGAVNVVTDMINGATKEGGAMGGLVVLGGLIAAIWKFGFWKTMIGMLGIGLASEAAAGRIDLKGEMGKLEKAGASVAATASDLVDKVEGAVGNKTEGEKPIEKAELTESQKQATEKVRSHKNIANIIEKHGKTHPKENGTLDDYIGFINSPAFQEQKLSALIYTTNHNQSVFSNEGVHEFGIQFPPNLNIVLLKKVIRIYLTGDFPLSDPAQNILQGKKELKEFEIKGGLTKDSDKESTMKEIIEKLYLKKQ